MREAFALGERPSPSAKIARSRKADVIGISASAVLELHMIKH